MTNEPEEKPKGDPNSAHLDTFRAPNIDEDAAHEDDVQRPDDEGGYTEDTPPEIDAADVVHKVSQEMFYTTFEALFAAPVMVATMLPTLGMNPELWQAVAVQTEEKPAARQASDAAYRIISKNLPWILEYELGAYQDAITVLTFCGMKLLIVQTILKIQNQPPQKDVTPKDDSDGQAEPANDNEPAFKTGRTSPTSWMDAEGAA